MTGYDRAMAAIRGEKPDRVPAYTPTICSDVASAILGRPVQTGGPALWHAETEAWVQGKSAWLEFDTRLMEDVLALHRALHQEIIRFPWRNCLRARCKLDANTYLVGDPDGVHQIWRWDPQTVNFIPVHHAEPHAVEEWPKLAELAVKALEDRVRRARETCGLAETRLQEQLGSEMLVVAGGAGLSLGVDETSLMAALLEPDAVETILDCKLAEGMAQLEGLAARGVKVVLGGGDMADKNGPIYSPDLFRRFMLPRWKKIAARSRELGLHYVWRSDGNLWQVSDMLFLEAGFPGFGEVDHEATMTAAAVRTRYPELAIWANLSGDLLRRGSAKEVYRHSLGALESSGGRRYFHGCSNTILPGTPTANVEAMMRARDDFRSNEPPPEARIKNVAQTSVFGSYS